MNSSAPLNLILLNAGFALHHSDWNYSGIRSPYARIYYVISGTATVTIDNCIYSLKPDHLYLIPTFTEHSDACEGEFSLCYLHVFELNTTSLSVFELFKLPVEVVAHSIDLSLMKRVLQINPQRELKKFDPLLYDNETTLKANLAESAQSPVSMSMETQGILQQLISRFLVDAELRFSASDQRILNSLTFIFNHLTSEITIRQLAEMNCLSVDHYIRLFKKEMSCTPLHYIQTKRIEKAQSLLAFSSSTVKDIAYHLSFENVSYFNRLFKKLAGQTPVAYRRSVLGK